MKYYIEKVTNYSFEEAIEKVTNELKNEGFGVLTEINVQKTFKDRLGVDFRKYRILGACNPAKAHEALKADRNIGTMLPCNIIVQELENGKVEVAAVNPVASLLAVENQDVKKVAQEIEIQLQRVIKAL
ncbi:MAG: DUF302 domain-containing protein [Bacteroidales bacterium]|jgi:uncharacterized protein (DUF302 family)|nr:DUF302 domain-containing protein [Bacteroidales bacterium]MDD4385540.1 DUF302 domain-containing protein [Bacteroidales bacterium]MDY0198768.1 DUF302 domain-containing protein [Tenuifilaceae bacterium]